MCQGHGEGQGEAVWVGSRNPTPPFNGSCSGFISIRTEFPLSFYVNKESGGENNI